MDKKIPLRMCVVCRQMKPKAECIRVVKINDTEYIVDKTGKVNGRGAYVCKDNDCMNKCLKTRAFNRSFKHNVSDSVYTSIKENTFE